MDLLLSSKAEIRCETRHERVFLPPGCNNFQAMVVWPGQSALMTTPSAEEITQLLGDWSSGDEQALEKLIPLVQPELHRLAHHYMSRERAGHTLQTTELLDEAYRP